MMELKAYQRGALETLTRWLENLEETRRDSENMIEALKQIRADAPIPDEFRNYPKTTWKKLAENGGVAATAGEYVDRTDDANRPIPHICFKVPTGGGKTLLAAAALERLPWQRGLVLWIVPSKAIYAQTKAALWDKQHPYRKMLNRASAGRVKMLEKEDIFNREDIANYLCVMLLMLPATNRQKGKEFLRMFKDSGRYPNFFPDIDNIFGNTELLNEFPDLECHTERGLVKQSLFNVFKLLRPVVVLDEAHKAYGAKNTKSNEEFAKSINRLDPRMVIELSATPNRGISNLLVDIGGPDLKKEEMIKLPVQVTSFPNAEWQLTLSQAVDELERLDAKAKSFENSTGRYIRPIAVVRVERTGSECERFAMFLEQDNHPYVVVLDGDYEILESTRSPHHRIVWLHRHSFENYLLEEDPIDKFRHYRAPLEDSLDRLPSSFREIAADTEQKFKELLILDVAHQRAKTGCRVFPKAPDELFAGPKTIDFNNSEIKKLCNKAAQGIDEQSIEDARTLVQDFLKEHRFIDLLPGHFAFGIIRRWINYTVNVRQRILEADIRVFLSTEVWHSVKTRDHNSLKRRLHKAVREAEKIRQAQSSTSS